MADKPEAPASRTVATELFVLDRCVALAELERLRRERQDPGRVGGAPQGEADPADTRLGDLADHLLPALVARGAVLAVPVTGYWKDVGRPAAYLQAHRDLLRGRVDAVTEPARPVLTNPGSGLPAHVRDGATVRDSLLGRDVVVHGEVERSVLGPGVVVRVGARVVDSVLLEDVVVEAGATVHTAVLDRRVRIGRSATVGAAPRATRLREEDVTLVGADAVVRARTTLAAGGRMEPGATT